jgi:hypothetical protein
VHDATAVDAVRGVVDQQKLPLLGSGIGLA